MSKVDPQRWWILSACTGDPLALGMAFGRDKADAIAEFRDALDGDLLPPGTNYDAMPLTLDMLWEAYVQTRAWYGAELANTGKPDA